MKITSVAHYPRPRYPKKEAVLLHPELLKKLPGRWQAKAAAFTALSACIPMLLTGCGSAAVQQEADLGQSPGPSPTPYGSVFLLGSYRIMGMMVQPLTLTEEEAARIILDEAGKQGIFFETKNYPLANMPLPDETAAYLTENGYEFKDKTDTFVADGYNQGQNIGYEYISEEDISTLLQSGNFANYHTYIEDYKDALCLKIGQRDGNEKIGVFYCTDIYDPEKSEEDLRAQVREFIQLLQSQSVIS